MNSKLGIGLILTTAVALAAVVALNGSGERPSVPEPDDSPVAKARAVAAPDRSLSARKLSAILDGRTLRTFLITGLRGIQDALPND